MSNFASELQAHLESDPALTRRGRKILEVLKSRPSKKRDRKIARMERHARAQLAGQYGFPENTEAKIDWSQIDWKKVINIIIQILSVLLMFI